MADRRYSQELQACAIGTLAGLVNGLALNQLATVKYHVWTTTSSVRPEPTFAQACQQMYQANGVRPFFRGIVATGACRLHSPFAGCVNATPPAPICSC
jgi:hypothetical protein